MVEFFDSLSLFGFLGVALWGAFIVSIFVKPHWYIDYYERFPRFDVFEEYVYGLPRQIAFMIIRFIVIAVIIFVIGRAITFIGASY